MERARDTHLDLDRRALVDHVSWLELLLEPFDLLRLRVAVQKRRVRRHDGLGRDASSHPKAQFVSFGEVCVRGGKRGTFSVVLHSIDTYCVHSNRVGS